MGTKWYRLPDRDNYEVSDEERPRVRNRSTGAILKTTQRKTVSLYFDPKHKSVMFSVYHLQYAAIHGIKARNIPKDIIITKENGKFKLTDRRAWCVSMNDRFMQAFDTDTQLMWIKETAEFLLTQEQAIQSNDYGALAELLYSYKRRSVTASGKFMSAATDTYREMNDYVGTAIVNVIEKIMRGEVIINHPTTAIKNELVRYIRGKRYTVAFNDKVGYRNVNG